MIKFNPENKEELTSIEILGQAIQITDQAEATQFLADYVKYIQSHLTPGSKENAEDIAKSNIGYFAGYCSNDVRKRVEKLFKCKHPIFGKFNTYGNKQKVNL
jgi:hypothetical protein